MAKQLYDYWFVQFDFPDENGKPYKSSGGKMVWNEKLKREIPEGWYFDKLSEIVDIGPYSHRLVAVPGLYHPDGCRDHGLHYLPGVLLCAGAQAAQIAHHGDLLPQRYRRQSLCLF